MLKDRLFTPTRRDFFRMTRDTALVALLGACAPEVSSPSTPEPTSSPITTLPIATLRSPATSPSRAPATLSPEEEMMEKAEITALLVWLNTLSRKQQNNDTFTTTLETAILNYDEVWRRENFNRGNTNISPDKPLRATWKAIRLSPGIGVYKPTVTKFIGEMNSSEIKARVQNKTTAADAANKEWRGIANVSFLRQARAILDVKEIAEGAGIASVQGWIDEPIKPGDPPFSKWGAESRQFDLVFTNGQLNGVGTLSFPYAGGLPMLKSFELPSALLLETSSPFGACFTPGSWCKVIPAK